MMTLSFLGLLVCLPCIGDEVCTAGQRLSWVLCRTNSRSTTRSDASPVALPLPLGNGHGPQVTKSRPVREKHLVAVLVLVFGVSSVLLCGESCC